MEKLPRKISASHHCTSGNIDITLSIRAGIHATLSLQPCTIPDKSPEETVPEEPQQDEKGGDGDGASASSTETSGEGPSTSSEGAHFSYDKPAKQETDATSDDNKIDEWFDIV